MTTFLLIMIAIGVLELSSGGKALLNTLIWMALIAAALFIIVIFAKQLFNIAAIIFGIYWGIKWLYQARNKIDLMMLFLNASCVLVFDLVVSGIFSLISHADYGTSFFVSTSVLVVTFAITWFMKPFHSYYQKFLKTPQSTSLDVIENYNVNQYHEDKNIS